MKKVYIIDDDRNIVESISMVLEKEGYKVSAQYNEENAVERVAVFRPDIVILDVIFPEDDSAGFKIAKALKNDEKTQDIPILMLSAINEKGIYAGTFSNRDIDDTYLPVNGFVEKPIKPKALLERIQNIIG